MMSNISVIKIKTLTPIWTGGVSGKCDKLYETGILGSLRWWYEIIVRGLGGDVCDPTNDKRCTLSGKEKTDEERIKKMCQVCYLFGCGGWKRRFQFHIDAHIDASIIPLHFRTTMKMNKKWIEKIFVGESQNIDNLNIVYGDITFKIIARGDDTEYTHSQLIMLFNFISKYGGFGAKLQHGFGQIKILEPESVNDEITINKALKELGNKIKIKALKELANGIKISEYFEGYIEKVNIPYNLENYVTLDYKLAYNLENYVTLDYKLTRDSLEMFIKNNFHIGNNKKNQEEKYIPCVFDLRYKGQRNFGMRKWLENVKKLDHQKINRLMGVRETKKEKPTDKDRASSHIYFGMPYNTGNDNYQLRIFGFAPSDILNPWELIDLCKDYMIHAFGNKEKFIHATLGSEIIKSLGSD